MAWLVLVGSGVLEAVWAVALSKSEGFSQIAPTIVFLVALAASMIGLGYAVKSIPIGVAYAVWTGIGVVGTTAFSLATGAEPVTVVRILLMLGLVACIAGLKIVGDAA